MPHTHTHTHTIDFQAYFQRRSQDVKSPHFASQSISVPYKHHSDSLITMSLSVCVCVCVCVGLRVCEHPKLSHEPVIDPRSLVACAEDHANKITTLQTGRGDLARWATETTNSSSSSDVYSQMQNYTCQSKFGPLHYFTAGVTHYFHTMKRSASEWAKWRLWKVTFMASSSVFWEVLNWGLTTCCHLGTHLSQSRPGFHQVLISS